MNVFEVIKESVAIGTVLKYYGLEFKRNKAICCFHSENDPSLTYSDTKQIFKCHACGETGDTIAFVSKLFNIKSFEACKKINKDFGLGIKMSSPTIRDILATQNKITERKNKIKKERQDFSNAVNLFVKYKRIIENSTPYSEAWCYAQSKILIAEYHCLEMIGVEF